VLTERRKASHEQIAQAIEQLFHDCLEEHYSELAHHYSRSGNTPKAIDYLHRAGQQAVQQFAHPEAVTHFTTALKFFKTLPETPSARNRNSGCRSPLKHTRCYPRSTIGSPKV
jgi:predicted ATPase